MFEELSKTFNGVDPEYKPAAGFDTAEGLVGLIVIAIVHIAIGVTLAALIYSFIQMMMAQGDPKHLEKSIRSVYWSAIAFGIALLTFTLRNVVFSALGL